MAFFITINVVGLVMASVMWMTIHYLNKDAAESSARDRRAHDTSRPRGL